MLKSEAERRSYFLIIPTISFCISYSASELTVSQNLTRMSSYGSIICGFILERLTLWHNYLYIFFATKFIPQYQLNAVTLERSHTTLLVRRHQLVYL